jgi:hypothetical protein
MKRKILSATLLLSVACFATLGVGCPKDPYRASLQGSDDVSSAVHSAVKISATYYQAGTISDSQKATVANFLVTVTNCNMKFRGAAVTAHNAGQVGVSAFLPIADSFVQCAEADRSVMSDLKIYNILKAVDAGINGVSLAVASAKGGQ